MGSRMGVVLVAQVHVAVVMIVLLEHDRVGLRSSRPHQAQSRREGVRLRNLLQALQEVAPVREGKCLLAAIGTDRLDSQVARAR